MRMIPGALAMAAVVGGAAVYLIGDATQDIPTPPQISDPVSVRVDATSENQVMDGFGAANLALIYQDGRDVLSPTLRSRALDAIYNQVGITMGGLEANLLESPGSYDARRNDNGDPDVFDWSGFQGWQIDAANSGVLGLREAKNFTNYYITQKINTRWASPWLAALRNQDYQRYLDEAAEQVAAQCIYWRDNYGGITPLLQLFNEPLSGNTEVAGGRTQDLVDLVQHAGDRLRREGFDSVRFVVPNDETEEISYQDAQAILANPASRQYVGAIGYHPYPLGSSYANVPRLLRTSGMGQPEPDRIQARQQLRELARKYNLPLWMTEVSMGGVDARSYDDFRARAIHIHDELTYANASAYFGMNNMWDMETQREHYGSSDSFWQQEGNIVLLDNATDTVYITGMGYAIGHYARWIGNGAVRIDATASDGLFQATAFKDAAKGRIVLVLINNSKAGRPVTISMNGVTLAGPATGEQSTPYAYWALLPPQFPSDASSVRLTVPGLSVTTLAVGFQSR